jgi:hypothetical protein
MKVVSKTPAAFMLPNYNLFKKYIFSLCSSDCLAIARQENNVTAETLPKAKINMYIIQLIALPP